MSATQSGIRADSDQNSPPFGASICQLMAYKGSNSTMARLKKSFKWSNSWLIILLGVISLVLFTLIITWVNASFAAQSRSDQKQTLFSIDKINVSLTLSILRLSQAILSSLTTFLLQECFQLLQWSLVSSKRGLAYPSLLSVSPTTGFLGMWKLITSSTSKGSSKVWVLLRALLMLIVWVASLVLFFDTSIATIYDTSLTYNVTAGVGAFNGSYVSPFTEYLNSKFPTFPYTYYAPVYNFVNNPAWSTLTKPLNCTGSKCFSYLLSGGVLMTTPWIPLGHDYSPLVRIENVPSIQMEFVPREIDFQESDCQLFGATGISIAVQLCLLMVEGGEIEAGIVVCTFGLGSDGYSCNTTTPAPKISTTARFFQRGANITVARSNFSITNVESMTTPIPLTDIDLPAYRLALNWLLNFTAANIPAPSSIVEGFWSNREVLRDPAYYALVSQNLQGILAFPFWLFNDNNYGNLALQAETVISTLPAHFHTQASIVTPYSVLRFSKRMFHLFIALQSIIMFFFVCVLLWVWVAVDALPKISAYTLFDAMYKSRLASRTELGNVTAADESRIMGMIDESRVVLKLD